MIIVQVKEGENIEKALKKFKRKFERTGIVIAPPDTSSRLRQSQAISAQDSQNHHPVPVF